VDTTKIESNMSRQAAEPEQIFSINAQKCKLNHNAANGAEILFFDREQVELGIHFNFLPVSIQLLCIRMKGCTANLKSQAFFVNLKLFKILK